MKRTFFWVFIAFIFATSVFGYDHTAAATDTSAAQSLMGSVQLAEWMGPLAPIALSPFFGLACLSGASLLIERGLLPEQTWLSGNPALNHPSVFIALLVLAVLTSLPRLTKVSKPIAQLGDFLETYTGIVLMVVIHYVGQREAGGLEPPVTGLVHASLFGGMEFIVIAAVSAINILVIQTVRWFFEALIFLSPIPFLDAFFELINKTFCLTLVALFVFSPFAALVVNGLMLAFCLVIFRGVHRRVVAYRKTVLLPLWRRMRGPSVA